MFFTELGLIKVSRSPGESLNQYYKKSEEIIKLLKTQSYSQNKKTIQNMYITDIQVNNIYNKAFKEVSMKTLGCIYY
jgi:hypothetical protein